jgi:hypothetical protein
MCMKDTYSEVPISKLLSDAFPIQNGPKQKTCFTATGFQLCFGISRQEGLRKS